jgi:sugar O-acyltransferase (sialic acid O-acetyltransferase NeuD family)
VVVAGAGGHALEILDLLQDLGEVNTLFFYGNKVGRNRIQDRYTVVHTLEDIKTIFQSTPEFIIGIGNPEERFEVYQKFNDLGGQLEFIQGSNAKISRSAKVEGVDIFNFCHVGGEVQIGKGCLINTGSQIHHEVRIGEFSVVSPRAILLGACQVGDFCNIGANATILPGIRIGHRVTIGAGAVIIQDVEDEELVVGVPGMVICRRSSVGSQSFNPQLTTDTTDNLQPISVSHLDDRRDSIDLTSID